MTPLVWIDLEMTGLHPEQHHILEIASVVTDSELSTIAEGPDLVIHQTDGVLAGMNEWCQKQHAESGLVDLVKGSTCSLDQAEEITLAFLRQHTTDASSPLCGNSVGLDYRFIERHMPELAAFLGDQILDVTTIKELARRWAPDKSAPSKAESHRARDDILESVRELRFYREHLFL